MSEPLNLNTNDILGIIQRQLMELNAYVSQPPQNVDPQVVFYYLERAASFAQRIPGMVSSTADEGTEARKN